MTHINNYRVKWVIILNMALSCHSEPSAVGKLSFSNRFVGHTCGRAKTMRKRYERTLFVFENGEKKFCSQTNTDTYSVGK